ncbi:MAG: hypothetical protein ACRD5B_11870 [Nitrososphaeraceae archaeon]
MKRSIFVVMIVGVITATMIASATIRMPVGVSASKDYCAESKDGSQADPACLPGQSKQECKDGSDKISNV